MFIIATIYKKPLQEEKVRALCKMNTDALRIKFAHNTKEEILEAIQNVQKIIRSMDSKTALHVDLPEAKFRFGEFPEKIVDVEAQKEYQLRAAPKTESLDDFIPVRTESLKGFFAVGDHVLTGDGQLSFTVKAIHEDHVSIEFDHAGGLHHNGGIFSNRIAEQLDHLKPVLESIAWFEGIFPEYISISFASSAKHVETVREKIKELYGDRWNPVIMAKIESKEGLEHAEGIIKAADMVVVARGDLALFTNPYTSILEQKRICKLANIHGKPVIVATQIMESICTSAMPKRSELADFTNILLDGADGVWLSKETCFHERPAEVISFIRKMEAAIRQQTSHDNPHL